MNELRNVPKGEIRHRASLPDVNEVINPGKWSVQHRTTKPKEGESLWAGQHIATIKLENRPSAIVTTEEQFTGDYETAVSKLNSAEAKKFPALVDKAKEGEIGIANTKSLNVGIEKGRFTFSPA